MFLAFFDTILPTSENVRLYKSGFSAIELLLVLTLLSFISLSVLSAEGRALSRINRSIQTLKTNIEALSLSKDKLDSHLCSLTQTAAEKFFIYCKRDEELPLDADKLILLN